MLGFGGFSRGAVAEGGLDVWKVLTFWCRVRMSLLVDWVLG